MQSILRKQVIIGAVPHESTVPHFSRGYFKIKKVQHDCYEIQLINGRPVMQDNFTPVHSFTARKAAEMYLLHNWDLIKQYN